MLFLARESASFSTRIAYGLTISSLEAAVGRSPVDGGTQLSAVDIINQATANGDPLVTLSGADLPALNLLPLSQEAVARIRAALLEGKVIWTPGRMVQVGDVETVAWWEFDPITGATIAVGENGYHAEAVEFAATAKDWESSLLMD